MKTAVSLPDHVFSEADQLARRLKKSRSELYAMALSEFIARHAPDDEITEAMNRVCAKVKERPDPALQAAALRTLKKVEW
jgi:metal-responsive CopG/Arc/MetJ family transcriptional regulator